MGCHFRLQCMKVESEREVAQSCPTLRNPMDCSLPDSSVRGIFHARVLEWGAIAFSNRMTIGFSYAAVAALILLLIIILPCIVRILRQSIQRLATELHLAVLRNTKRGDAGSRRETSTQGRMLPRAAVAVTWNIPSPSSLPPHLLGYTGPRTESQLNRLPH